MTMGAAQNRTVRIALMFRAWGSAPRAAAAIETCGLLSVVPTLCGLSIAQLRVHLPDQQFRRLARGHPPAVGVGEPDRVALPRSPTPSHVTAPRGDEKVQVGGRREGSPRRRAATAWRAARHCGCAGRWRASSPGHARGDRHQVAAQQFRRQSRAADSSGVMRGLVRDHPHLHEMHWLRRRSRSSPNAGCRCPPTCAGPGRDRSRRDCRWNPGVPVRPAGPRSRSPCPGAGACRIRFRARRCRRCSPAAARGGCCPGRSGRRTRTNAGTSARASW